MKVKQQPGDFRVEELTTVRPGPAGDFAFYRLNKVGWTTPDAIRVVRGRWGLDARRVSFGGLKDRHAQTTQYYTVFRGPGRDLSQQGIAVTYLGQVAEPYTSQHITANRFAITIRHLTAPAEQVALAAVREVNETGLPNYFDDQRFGSVGRDREFVGREMVRGRFEAALKLALASPYEHDRAAQKREKETLRRHWGDWTACRKALPRGHARFLVEYLAAHPTDFRGAVARLRPELGGLYLAAYQSYLWNRMLDRWLRDNCPADALDEVSLKLGEFAVPLRPADGERWHGLTLPLPSARQKPEPGAEWCRIAKAVLAAEGLTLAALKVPGMNKPFFSKGERAACVRLTGVRADPGDDERHPGRRKLLLAFELPRGSYATMVVKRVMA
ncbi:MAG TPA: tRNA pseudouridine(13) synthase TruD [Fimbriiglobus sp.]|nr:tRNA pseudouridine(13) synthase TruD [Fimbriiglobus sp.]